MAIIINSLKDLAAWLENENPASCLTGERDMQGMAQRFAWEFGNVAHPAFGEDWSAWLNENAERIVRNEMVRVVSDRAVQAREAALDARLHRWQSHPEERAHLDAEVARTSAAAREALAAAEALKD